MNRNHVCDICDTEADSWTEIPITEGWLNEDGYPSGRKTSLVICDDCFEKLREMIVEFKEVRCKDCKYVTKHYDYCAWGEPREDAD